MGEVEIPLLIHRFKAVVLKFPQKKERVNYVVIHTL